MGLFYIVMSARFTAAVQSDDDDVQLDDAQMGHLIEAEDAALKMEAEIAEYLSDKLVKGDQWNALEKQAMSRLLQIRVCLYAYINIDRLLSGTLNCRACIIVPSSDYIN